MPVLSLNINAFTDKYGMNNDMNAAGVDAGLVRPLLYLM